MVFHYEVEISNAFSMNFRKSASDLN